MSAYQYELNNWYTYHAPQDGQEQIYTVLRAKAKELAELFNGFVPKCPDADFAHYQLRMAVMAMNNAIACNEKRF